MWYVVVCCMSMKNELRYARMLVFKQIIDTSKKINQNLNTALDQLNTIQSNKNITMAAAKPVVKISAMPAQMQADATIFAADGLNLFYEENDVAGYVKEQFEKKVRVQQ